jgi:hypothetical protein
MNIMKNYLILLNLHFILIYNLLHIGNMMNSIFSQLGMLCLHINLASIYFIMLQLILYFNLVFFIFWERDYFILYMLVVWNSI